MTVVNLNFELKDISNEDLQIQVAELLGWHKDSSKPERGSDMSLPWRSPQDTWLAWDDWELPNYPEDLNACQDMESTLTGDGVYKYYAVLCQLCVDLRIRHFASAPARTRCEAFVLTMEGVYV